MRWIAYLGVVALLLFALHSRALAQDAGDTCAVEQASWQTAFKSNTARPSMLALNTEKQAYTTLEDCRRKSPDSIENMCSDSGLVRGVAHMKGATTFCEQRKHEARIDALKKADLALQQEQSHQQIVSQARAMHDNPPPAIRIYDDTGRPPLDERGGQWDTAARFTPREYANAAYESGWHLILETETDAYWISYWTGSRDEGTAIVLKNARKGMGTNFTGYSFAFGFTDCRGAAAGHYPTALNNVGEQEFSPIGLVISTSGAAPIPEVAPERHSALALAIVRGCDLVARAKQ